MELMEILQAPWVWRAIGASAMVGIMCGVLGCFIVLRNMALIGDALSHAILPGVVVAFVIFGYSIAGFFLGSVLAGLLTAIVITWVQQKIKTKNDAAIGIIFTAMFSIGVIGISYISKNEGVHLDLKDFLFGNVLGVSNEDLVLTFVICMYVILSIWFFYRYFFITTFQPTIAKAMGIATSWVHYLLMILLSFAVVASLQTVGVILVVAMLITPASAALMWSDKLNIVLWISAAIGLSASVLGFIAAIIFNTTPGPAMAIVATAMYFISALAAPKKGLISKFFKKRALRNKILKEDIIKAIFQIYRRHERKATYQEISKHLNSSIRKVRKQTGTLIRKNLISKDQNSLLLTEKGKAMATKLVRAHRLWETYLVNEIGLSDNQIHKDAEDQEHFMSEDFIDEVDRTLGYPSTDPHGSPIPESSTILRSKVISDLEKGNVGHIAKEQFHPDSHKFLLENKIKAHATLLIEDVSEEKNSYIFSIDNETYKVPLKLANKIELEVE